MTAVIKFFESIGNLIEGIGQFVVSFVRSITGFFDFLWRGTNAVIALQYYLPQGLLAIASIMVLAVIIRAIITRIPFSD